jgi:fatty acid desaturase
MGASQNLPRKDRIMLWTLCVVFLVLWALGFVAFHVSSGLIHLLLLAALIALVFQLISGRRTV